MKFSTITTSFLLVVSCTICSEVAAFCSPEQPCSKTEDKYQFLRQAIGLGLGLSHAVAGTRSQTRLRYAPKRQDEESKTRLNYVSNRQKKDDSTDLYYAPSTSQEYEIPVIIDKFITSSGKIINPFRETNNDAEEHDAKISTHQHQHQHQNNDEPFFFASIIPSVNKKSDEEEVLDMVPKTKVQNTRSEETTFMANTKQQGEYSHHSAIEDLPSAVAYATSLSFAAVASGITMAAKTLAGGLEESAKVSKHVEDSFAEMALEIKPKDSNPMTRDNGFLDNIGERIRHNSKNLPGSGSDDDPLPELVQSLMDQADKVLSSSSEFWNTNKKQKIASVPPPNGKQYYSPFEACNILYQHEMHQGMDKPKAMKIMLDNKYVPVGRSQLYKVFRQFKDGKVTEEKQWGQRGRPRKVFM